MCICCSHTSLFIVLVKNVNAANSISLFSSITYLEKYCALLGNKFKCYELKSTDTLCLDAFKVKRVIQNNSRLPLGHLHHFVLRLANESYEGFSSLFNILEDLRDKNT